MQKDRETGAITHMEAEEVTIYDLYLQERDGLSRGFLPYTPQFDRIVARYNETTGTNTSNRDVWRLMENTLKGGVELINTYLGR